MRRISVLFRFLSVVAALIGGLAAARAEDQPRRQAVAGAHYKASGIHRFLFGADYRDLWTMPVTLPVLDLQHYGGGLKPVRRVGGQETKGLAMKGADGRDYTFRGLDKDPSEILPPELRESVARDIVQDQISSTFPAGYVVAPVLLEAAGVLHVTPELVVMPDDPALGEFRSVFANLVGTVELYPQAVGGGNPGFHDATEIIKPSEMAKRLQASSADRVDARAFLRARLIDVFMGDWDRHREQWRWARLPASPLWQPIPEDRDEAFCRFEGLFISVLRHGNPRLMEFGPKYSDITGATFNGWDQDRRLLTGLDRAAWDEVARDVQARLTDAVLETAVSRMPPEFRAREGARLLAGMKARRDKLTEQAGVFYRHLADKVDAYATDRPDRVEIVGGKDGSVEVTIAEAAEGATPYYHRTLLPAETDEVRIHLGAGDDHVVARGESSPITVRVIGDAGCETVEDAGRLDVRVSDVETCTRVTGAEASLHSRPYVPPPGDARAPWIPPRDWGATTLGQPWLRYTPDIGVFLGVVVNRESYGFRKDPYASSQRFRAGWGFGAGAGRADYRGDFHLENSPVRLTFFAVASGIEILRYYGLGNETKALADDNANKVKQRQYAFSPTLAIDLGKGVELGVGPIVQYSSTAFKDGQLITAVKPYGAEAFGQLGGHVTLNVDRRDQPGYARSGGVLHVQTRGFLGTWDVKSGFGEVHGDASTYLTPGSSLRLPTLALRVGGKHVWGEYPFQEAAYIGGHTTVRGFRSQRFGGDSSFFANAELRLPLGHFMVLLPGEIGIFGLSDVGRVWLAGETSDTWHTAFGGGVWLSFISRKNTLSIAVANSEQRTGLYIDAGFMF